MSVKSMPSYSRVSGNTEAYGSFRAVNRGTYTDLSSAATRVSDDPLSLDWVLVHSCMHISNVITCTDMMHKEQHLPAGASGANIFVQFCNFKYTLCGCC
jgi:hypothetical protein